jgi:hypothetical protein
LVDDGFLVVNLWWNRGDLGCVDGYFLESKIFHFLAIYFWGFPFWKWVVGLEVGLGKENESCFLTMAHSCDEPA